MRSLSETGEPGDRLIPLNKPRKSEVGDESSASAFLDGFPGETIALGEDHAAILISNKSGSSQHKVALIDLKKLQVDSVIQTISAAEQNKILTGRYAKAILLNLLLRPEIASGLFTDLTLKNEMLAARPDGRFLYALDIDSHEVTVIDVQTATVVRRIPVDYSIIKLQLSSDGKRLLCFPASSNKGRAIQKIDLASNNIES